MVNLKDCTVKLLDFGYALGCDQLDGAAVILINTDYADSVQADLMANSGKATASPQRDLYSFVLISTAILSKDLSHKFTISARGRQANEEYIRKATKQQLDCSREIAQILNEYKKASGEKATEVSTRLLKKFIEAAEKELLTIKKK